MSYADVPKEGCHHQASGDCEPRSLGSHSRLRILSVKHFGHMRTTAQRTPGAAILWGP